MKHKLLILIAYSSIFSHFQENFFAESTNPSSCPVRSSTELRGSPGLPGRTGSKGNVGVGQKGKKGEKGQCDDATVEISNIERILQELQANISEAFDQLQQLNRTQKSQCDDIDECLTNNGNCNAQATCLNTLESYICVCNLGYSTADAGTTCTDIDECLTNNGGCSAQATCINTPGSRVCQCNSGFNSSDGGVTCYTEPQRYTSTATGNFDDANAYISCPPGMLAIKCECEEKYCDGTSFQDNECEVTNSAQGRTSKGIVTCVQYYPNYQRMINVDSSDMHNPIAQCPEHSVMTGCASLDWWWQRVTYGIGVINRTTTPYTCRQDYCKNTRDGCKVQARCLLWCDAGMKSGRISDQQISQSSYWICDGFEYKGILGRLDHRWCWIANQHKQQAGEWIQVDFRTPTRISGVVTQGRDLEPNSSYPFSYQWVTSYKIQFGNSSGNLQFIQMNGSDKIFPGNIDQNTHVINKFSSPIAARYFRLVVQSFLSFISLRMEYLTC